MGYPQDGKDKVPHSSLYYLHGVGGSKRKREMSRDPRSFKRRIELQTNPSIRGSSHVVCGYHRTEREGSGGMTPN